MIVLGIDAPQGWALLGCATSTPVYLDAGELDQTDAPVALAALLTLHKPDLVAIEKVGVVVGREGFGPNMAGHLYASGWVGGQLYDRARSMGFTTVDVEAPHVRKALGIRAPKGQADVVAARILRMRCPTWPPVAKPGQRSSTVHERDAALAAIYAVTRHRVQRAGLVSR